MYKDRWSNKFDIWYLKQSFRKDKKFKIWDFMKKNYINPEVQVAQFASMALMQAASPANLNIHTDIPGEQW